jgi:hypothetical protein
MMSLSEIEKEAVALSESERAELVRKLLDTLALPNVDVSDEEVAVRDRELEGGSVKPISHAEFVRGVEKERRG